MASYKHPCKYCGKLIARDSNYCPFCTKKDPLGPMRCPICSYPLEDGAKICGNCGLPLWVMCKSCAKETFIGEKCCNCSASILVVCPNPKCKTEQPPTAVRCIKCGKPLR